MCKRIGALRGPAPILQWSNQRRHDSPHQLIRSWNRPLHSARHSPPRTSRSIVTRRYSAMAPSPLFVAPLCLRCPHSRVQTQSRAGGPRPRPSACPGLAGSAAGRREAERRDVGASRKRRASERVALDLGSGPPPHRRDMATDAAHAFTWRHGSREVATRLRFGGTSRVASRQHHDLLPSLRRRRASGCLRAALMHHSRR